MDLQVSFFLMVSVDLHEGAAGVVVVTLVEASFVVLDLDKV